MTRGISFTKINDGLQNSMVPVLLHARQVTFLLQRERTGSCVITHSVNKLLCYYTQRDLVTVLLQIDRTNCNVTTHRDRTGCSVTTHRERTGYSVTTHTEKNR